MILALAPGGLHSRSELWLHREDGRPRGIVSPVEAFSEHFTVLTLDQRNALPHSFYRTTSTHDEEQLAGLFCGRSTFAAVAQAQAGDLYSSIIGCGKVRIGVNLSGLPFGTYKPSTQTPAGFAVELAQDIGHELGVETEIVSVVAANRAVFLKQGKVDLLIANMTVTPGRAEQLDYPPLTSNWLEHWSLHATRVLPGWGT